jgi:hypothetical protein
LQPRQQVALSAFLATGSVVEAAKTAGCSERTMRRWTGMAAFQEALRASARDSAREATTALLAAQVEAVATLRTALRTGTPAGRKGVAGARDPGAGRRPGGQGCRDQEEGSAVANDRDRLAARLERVEQLIPAGTDDGPTIGELLGDYPAALEALGRLIDPESSEMDRFDATEVVYAFMKPSAGIVTHLRAVGLPAPVWPV